MASHSLAIAKASFAASMMRPDPISIPRTEIARFHVLLEAVLKQCSPINIQLCKDWLLENVVTSASRTAAVGKYLVALSGSFRKPPEDTQSQLLKNQRPSGRRRQLYILYLLNDLLHHTKYHFGSPSSYSILAKNLQSSLLDLVGSVSAHSIEVYGKHHAKIEGLLNIWDGSGYYHTSYIGKLRQTVANAARLGYLTSDEDSKASNGVGEAGTDEARKDAPYIMPATHGDPSVPFYDLPAGNMLPHIMPNSATPINPQLVKPLQFTAGPADEILVTAVKDFLRNIESMDEVCFEDGGIAMDADELGQSVVRDEITGDILEANEYYGWSRAFCERMKRRGNGTGDTSNLSGRDGGVDRSTSPRKRRYSDSSSSRSRGRSRTSSVRSRQGKRVRNGRDHSLSTSRSRSPRREQKPYRSLRSRSRSMSRSSSYSPPPIGPPSQPQQSTDPRPLPRNRAQARSPTQPQPPLVHPFPPNSSPAGPRGLPIPPPPPPNYNGPWPPPPPPIAPNNVGYAQSIPPFPPPIGPRTRQSHGPPSFQQGHHNGFQSQILPHPESWGQGQQQPGPGCSYPHGGRGRAHAPLAPGAQNSRGSGFEQRWTG